MGAFNPNLRRPVEPGHFSPTLTAHLTAPVRDAEPSNFSADRARNGYGHRLHGRSMLDGNHLGDRILLYDGVLLNVRGIV
eukprot:CAMPEP_0119330816 /NCGR_PEP_ID=MMETSP1333-20130426/79084_1 /TAXON_ID=418940 /ORGANISM="Scyphosphaera apsteinii, Strain RCC1455" /LENGTH=79 /DNA_ID=CAMNT_0007340281 /DNA_START=342 /DNA_END=579 /DNA_ORIENTATION=-